MPVTASQQQFMTINCADCKKDFHYPYTRSNNYSKFCESCRKIRTASNKRRFDERRSSSAEPAPQRDIFAMLEDIPDYVMHPVRLIDAAMRDST